MYNSTGADRFPSLWQALKQDISDSLHCALPGTVETFDPETQTADIRIAVRKKAGGKELELPLLRDVPVCMPLHFEVSPGDACLVVFADCDTDAWQAGEESAPVRSGRTHALSDGFAFVGFQSGGGQSGGPDLDNYYTRPETDGLLAEKAEAAHTHDAADVATGTLPLARGGTGRGSTGSTTTISDIATAASGCEITTAQYAYWGKVAMVRLVVKKSAAVSSGTTTLCTLVSGKRPKYNAAAVWSWNKTGMVTTAGNVQVNGAISAGASLTILSTFILS